MNKQYAHELSAVLNSLKNKIVLVTSLLEIDNQLDISGWVHILEPISIPMVSADFPLIAAICGGGSSGKSTLFNALVGKKISPTGGRAGMNRKVLVAFHENFLVNSGFLTYLFEPFGCTPEPLKNSSDLIFPGPPVYITSKTLPKNLILLDTPDFDTGSGGSYTNRDLAHQALKTADLFIYIFTNSNYKNRDNTDFMAYTLAGVGKKHCFLVYRIYPSFSSREITEHAMTVAQNIYGNDAEKYVLGIYRADEDNSVAAGEKFMQLYSVPENQMTLFRTLQSMDSEKQRKKILKTILHDIVQNAENIYHSCDSYIQALKRCNDALYTGQNPDAKETSGHFPVDRIRAGLSQLWNTSEAQHIKARRKKGDFIGFPFKAFVNVIKWAGEKTSISNKLSSKFYDKLKVEKTGEIQKQGPGIIPESEALLKGIKEDIEIIKKAVET